MEQAKLNPSTIDSMTLTTTTLETKTDLTTTATIEYRQVVSTPPPSPTSNDLPISAPVKTPDSPASITSFRRPSPKSSDSDIVRVIDIKEYKAAAKCLAEAFQFDEVARYLVDTDDMEEYGEEAKMRLHTEIMEYVTAAHVMKGVVTTVGDDYGAVALWMPPGKENDDWLTIFRSGMWRLFYKLSTEGKIRFYKEFLPLLHDTAHEVLQPWGGEAWYLVYLGTKPSSRGKGYARKLLEWGVKEANKTSHPTYLESSAIVNVPYYQKFGFQPIKDIHLMRAKRPVSMTIMVNLPECLRKESEEDESGCGRIVD